MQEKRKNNRGPKNKLRSALRYYFVEKYHRYPNYKETKEMLLNPPDEIVERWGEFFVPLYERMEKK